MPLFWDDGINLDGFVKSPIRLRRINICVTLHPSSLRSTVSTPHSSGWNMNVRRKDEDQFAVRSLKLATAARKP